MCASTSVVSAPGYRRCTLVIALHLPAYRKCMNSFFVILKFINRAIGAGPAGVVAAGPTNPRKNVV